MKNIVDPCPLLPVCKPLLVAPVPGPILSCRAIRGPGAGLNLCRASAASLDRRHSRSRSHGDSATTSSMTPPWGASSTSCHVASCGSSSGGCSSRPSAYPCNMCPWPCTDYRPTTMTGATYSRPGSSRPVGLALSCCPKRCRFLSSWLRPKVVDSGGEEENVGECAKI